MFLTLGTVLWNWGRTEVLILWSADIINIDKSENLQDFIDTTSIIKSAYLLQAEASDCQ